jgi:hypothetical protein
MVSISILPSDLPTLQPLSSDAPSIAGPVRVEAVQLSSERQGRPSSATCFVPPIMVVFAKRPPDDGSASTEKTCILQFSCLFTSV